LADEENMKGKVPSPPDEAQELSTEEARAGRTRGIVRYVLGVSLALVIIAFIIIYFAFI
jgi:hypothetical protein